MIAQIGGNDRYYGTEAYVYDIGHTSWLGHPQNVKFSQYIDVQVFLII